MNTFLRVIFLLSIFLFFGQAQALDSIVCDIEGAKLSTTFKKKDLDIYTLHDDDWHRLVEEAPEKVDSYKDLVRGFRYENSDDRPVLILNSGDLEYQLVCEPNNTNTSLLTTCHSKKSSSQLKFKILLHKSNVGNFVQLNVYGLPSVDILQYQIASCEISH